MCTMSYLRAMAHANLSRNTTSQAKPARQEAQESVRNTSLAQTKLLQVKHVLKVDQPRPSNVVATTQIQLL